MNLSYSYYWKEIIFYRTFILNYKQIKQSQSSMSKNTSNASPQSGLKSKLKKSSALKEFQQCKSHVYACFQQPETINIIPYLTIPTPNKLCFDSNKKKQNPAQSDVKDRFDKKQKQFKFSKIYQRQEKFKYAFSEQINLIVSKLFKGLSQTVFIYGTQQTKKDKILIGQSQNSGLLLTALSQIFQYCHEKQIQDQVTIKLSCMMYKNGSFTDVFGVFDTEQLKKQCSSQQQKQRQKDYDDQDYKRQKQSYKQNSNSIFCDDKLQKKYFLGVPQIIIRNMRTALKIINLICKKMQQRRDQHQENTQNLIYTIKVQLDTGYDRYTGQVFEYNIPKLHIIKLANPSVDNTLNGISKNNEWFINLFNFLQNQVRLQKNLKRLISQNNVQMVESSEEQRSQLQKLFITSQKEKSQEFRVSSSEKEDEFTTFIKDVALAGVSDIHCFTSITNKMTSNQCLTAFIFNNYILGYKTKPLKTILNIHLLKQEKNQIQLQLLNLFETKQSQIKKQKEILKKHKSSNSNSNVSKSCQKRQTSPKTKLTDNQMMLKTKTNFNSKNKDKYKQWISKTITQEEFQEEFDENKLLLLKYIENINKFTQSCNIVEYQYSLVFGAACQRLNKYIFNQQIQEFYYAKKVSTQVSTGLKESVWNLMQIKKYMNIIKQKMMKKINTQIGKLQSEIEYLKNSLMKLQTQEIMKVKKQRMFHLSKQRQIYIKIFQIYDTMAYHYLYQNNKTLMTNLQQTKLKVEEQLKLKNDQINNINYEQILSNIKKGFKKRIQQKKLPSLAEQENELQDQLNQILPQELKQKNQESLSKNQTIINQTYYKSKQKSSQTSKASPFNKTMLKQNQNSQRKGESITTWGCKKRKNMDQLQNMFTNSNVGRMSKTLYK